MKALPEQIGVTRTVAFTHDGEVLVAGDRGQVRLWNPVNDEVRLIAKVSTPLYALALASDGDRIAYGGRNDRGEQTPMLRMQSLHGRNPTWVVELPAIDEFRSCSIWSLGFSFEGRYLAVVTRTLGGGNITTGAGGFYWNFDDSVRSPLPDPTAFSLSFAPDRDVIALAGTREVGFYAAPDFSQAIARYPLSATRREAVAFIPGSKRAVVGAGLYLTIVESDQQAKPIRLKTESQGIKTLAVAPDGGSLLVAGRAGLVEIIDLDKLTVKTRYDFDTGQIHSVALSQDGLTFALGTERGVLLCDVE